MRKELIYLTFSIVLLPLAGCASKSIKLGKTTEAADTNNRLGEMVTIPAGSFLMGNNGHEGFGVPEEFPQHSVYLPTYQIGKYEVTRGQYRKFIEAGGYDDPKNPAK